MVEQPRFTAVVGNPPYQSQSVTEGAVAPAVYHQFMNVTTCYGKLVSLVYPARWMNGGTGVGLDLFRKTELTSKKYHRFYDFADSKKLFPHVTISGGVNYFLWDKDKHDGFVECFYNGEKCGNRETIANGMEDSYVRNPLYAGLITKIRPQNKFSTVVLPCGHYGESVNTTQKVEKLLEDKNGIIVYYTRGGVDLLTKKVSPQVTQRAVDDWKVFASASTNNDELSHRPSRAFIGDPDTICSSTYLKIGSFATEDEATNCLRYLKTDFATFLLGLLIPTQHAKAGVYCLIPLVDFSTGEIVDKPGVFLNFHKPETLDEQLAEIYELTAEERSMMSANLKPWKHKIDVMADK